MATSEIPVPDTTQGWVDVLTLDCRVLLNGQRIDLLTVRPLDTCALALPEGDELVVHEITHIWRTDGSMTGPRIDLESKRVGPAQHPGAELLTMEQLTRKQPPKGWLPGDVWAEGSYTTPQAAQQLVLEQLQTGLPRASRHCATCGETEGSTTAWRWESDHWTHRCPGVHPQAGHDVPEYVEDLRPGEQATYMSAADQERMTAAFRENVKRAALDGSMKRVIGNLTGEGSRLDLAEALREADAAMKDILRAKWKRIEELREEQEREQQARTEITDPGESEGADQGRKVVGRLEEMKTRATAIEVEWRESRIPGEKSHWQVVVWGNNDKSYTRRSTDLGYAVHEVYRDVMRLENGERNT